MNNKELTELKERFMSAYCEPNKLHHKWGDKLVDGEYYQYSPDDVWAWIELTVLPHLKSNDEIKREVGHCRLCNKETYCVYNINLKAISICESCGRAIAKQELDDMFQTQKENNE